MKKKVSKAASLTKIKKIAEEAGFNFTIDERVLYSDRVTISAEPSSSTVSILRNQILGLFKTKTTKLKFYEIAEKLGDPKALTIIAISDLVMEKKLARNQTYVWKV